VRHQINGECGWLVSNASHLLAKHHVAGADLLGGAGFAWIGIRCDGAGIGTRTGISRCLPARQLGGVAGNAIDLWAGVRSDGLQRSHGVPDGSGNLAIGRIAYLSRQPQFPSQPVISRMIRHMSAN